MRLCLKPRSLHWVTKRKLKGWLLFACCFLLNLQTILSQLINTDDEFQQCILFTVWIWMIAYQFWMWYKLLISRNFDLRCIKNGLDRLCSNRITIAIIKSMIVYSSSFPCSVFQRSCLDLILRVSRYTKHCYHNPPTVKCGSILLNVTCKLSLRLAVHLQNQKFAQHEHILTNVYF